MSTVAEPTRVAPDQLLAQLLAWYPSSVSFKGLYFELSRAGYLGREADAFIARARLCGVLHRYRTRDGQLRFEFDADRLAAAQLTFQAWAQVG